MSSDALWVEKYRPKSLSDYIFKNHSLRKKMEAWIESGQIPHIGFFGPPGTGKTSALDVLINELIAKDIIHPGDVTRMNMSEKGIDAVRDEIDAVACIAPFGSYRIFVLEEMEEMSLKSQGAMKRIMEEYVENARFILTSNKPHKIIEPILSRIQPIVIDSHDREQYTTHVVDILFKEGVQIDTDEELAIVDKYINDTYPDFRSTLNTLQLAIVDNKISPINDSVQGSSGYRTMIVDALSKGSIRQMRETIVKSVIDSEIDAFFTFLYQNVNLFTTDDVKEMKIYLALRDGAVKNSLVADRELNLSAVLCEIDMICNDIM